MRAVQVLQPTGPADVRVVDVPEPDARTRRRAGRGARRRHLVPRPAAEPGASTSSSRSRRSPSASTSPAPCVSAPRGAGLEPGQRVAGVVPYGGAAERAVIPASRCSRCPTRLSYDEGAALPMNYLTALFALAERGPAARAGETVLVHGAAGGVGTATHPGGQGVRRPHHRRRQHRREGRVRQGGRRGRGGAARRVQGRRRGAHRRPWRRRRARRRRRRGVHRLAALPRRPRAGCSSSASPPDRASPR